MRTRARVFVWVRVQIWNLVTKVANTEYLWNITCWNIKKKQKLWIKIERKDYPLCVKNFEDFNNG